MRPTYLASILTIALLLGAGFAVATGPDEDHKAQARERAAQARADANETRENHTASAQAHAANHTGERGNHSKASHTRDNNDSRPAAVVSFWARMLEIRQSWLENATKVREDCHAKSAGENATKEERLAVAHCIRDGYAELRERIQGELDAARAEFRAGMRASRS